MASSEFTQAHVFGLFHPTPDDAPPTLVVALWLWRVSVVLVPFTFFVTGSLMASTGAEMSDTATSMMSDPWLVFFTLGLIVLLAFLLQLVGVLLTFLATLFVIGAIPLGVLMSLSLGRTLAGASRGRSAAGLTLGLGTFFGLVGGAFVGASLAAATGVEPLAPLFTYGVFLVPLAAWILLRLPEHKHYLDARHDAWRARNLGGTSPGASQAAPARSPGLVQAPTPIAPASGPSRTDVTTEDDADDTAWRVGQR